MEKCEIRLTPSEWTEGAFWVEFRFPWCRWEPVSSWSTRALAEEALAFYKGAILAAMMKLTKGA